MSTDGGTVWTVKDNWFTDGGAYTNDPSNNSVYWSGGRYYTGGVYIMSVSKTTNSGNSWTRYELSSSAGWTYAIVVDPSNSDIVYAGGEDNSVGAIYKTVNGGTTWLNISSGISGYVYDLAIDLTSTSTIYAATANGVYKSVNGGSNWAYTGCTNARALLIDPDDASVIYAGTYSGVYKSTNGGGDWSAMNDGLDDTQINCLGINPNEYLFCGTEGGGMFRWEIEAGIEEGSGAAQHALHFTASPNPINQKAVFTYQLPYDTRVKISVYDIQGRCVRTLLNETRAAGIHTIQWDGADDNNAELPSGIYFGRITTDDDTYIQKLIVVR